VAREVLLILTAVVPEDGTDTAAAVADLTGRALPGLPGSWVTRARVLPIAAARHPSVRTHLVGDRPGQVADQKGGGWTLEELAEQERLELDGPEDTE
jgi:hypothetical protein